MVRPIVPGAKRGRGNPNWGKFLRPLPVVLTEFEVQVKRLGLSREHQFCIKPRTRTLKLNLTGGVVGAFGDSRGGIRIVAAIASGNGCQFRLETSANLVFSFHDKNKITIGNVAVV